MTISCYLTINSNIRKSSHALNMYSALQVD